MSDNPWDLLLADHNAGTSVVPAQDNNAGSNDGGISWTDYGRAVESGAYGLAGSLGGAAKYVEGYVQDPQFGGADYANEVRKWGLEQSQAAVNEMTPEAQRAYGANFLPSDTQPDVWDENVPLWHSLLLKVAGSSPSLAASVIPGGIVARALGTTAGLVTASGVNAALNSGDVYNGIAQTIDQTPSDQLAAESDAYKSYLDSGMGDAEARDRLVRSSAGYMPAVMAAISVGTAQFGLEGLVSRLAGHEASRGIVKNALLGAAGEFAQEGIENSSQSALQQLATDPITGQAFNWRDVGEQALQGAVVGGALGGVSGGAAGAFLGHEAQPPQGAVGNAPPPPVPPGAQVPPVSVVSNIGPDPAQSAALAATPPSAPQPPAQPPPAGVSPPVAGITNSAIVPPAGAAIAPAVAPDQTAGAQPSVVGATPAATTPVAPIPDTNLEYAADLGHEGTPEVAPLSQQEAPVPPSQEPVTVIPAPPPTPPSAPSSVPERAVQALPQPTLSLPPRPTNNVLGASAEELAARQRNVLPDVTPPPVVPAEKLPRQRVSKKEAARIGQEGVVTTALPLDQTWSGLSQGDRQKFRRIMLGNPSPWAVQARDGTAMSSRKNPLDTRQEGARLMAKAYEDFKKAQQASIETGGVRVPQAQVNRNTAEEARAALERQAADILNRAALPEMVRNQRPEVARAAAVSYVRSLVSDARESGLARRERIHGDTPAMAHLANAGRIVRENFPEDALHDFIVNDLLYRSGDKNAVLEARRAAAVKPSSGNVEQVADETPQTPQEEAPTPQPKDRPTIEVTPAHFTAGKDVGATTKVEVKRSFKINTNKDLSKAARPIDENPSDAQKEAGNYQKGHGILVGHIPVTIETAKGGTRSGIAPDGTEWSVKLDAHYGYVKRTTGADGDHVDVYIGPSPQSATVYVVDQYDPRTNKFDEHKAMLGFTSREEALAAYDKGFSDGSGPRRRRAVAEMGIDEFDRWANSPQSKRPAAGKAFMPAPSRDYISNYEDTTGYKSAWDKIAYDETKEPWGPRRHMPVQVATPGFVRIGRRSVPDLRKDPRSLVMKVPDTRIIDAITDNNSKTYDPTAIMKVGDFFNAVRVKPRAIVSKHTRYLAEKLVRKHAPNTYVVIMESAQLQELWNNLNGLKSISPNPDGWYTPYSDVIVISDRLQDRPEVMYYLAAHEGVHAALVNEMYDPKNKHVLDGFKLLYEWSKRKYFSQGGTEKHYGFSNVDEFLAEAFTDLSFQQALARVPVPEMVIREIQNNTSVDFGIGLKSLWQLVVNMVRKMFHLPFGEMSALEATLRATSAMSRRIGILARMEALRRGETFDTPPGLVPGPSFNFKKQQPTAKSQVPTHRQFPVWAKGLGFKLMTFDGIRRTAAGWFTDANGDALKSVQDVLQRTTPYVESLREKGLQVAQMLAEHAHANPTEAAIMAERAMNTTSLDIKVIDDPNWTLADLERVNKHFGKEKASGWQGKAHMEEAQIAFMALTPKGRAAWLKATAYYQAAQNETTRTLVGNLIDQLDKTNMAPAARTALVDKVIDGVLTSADEVALGKPLYNALSNARLLRLMHGEYFPMMRHGKYVVRTTDNLPTNLMGGVPDPKDTSVVTFRAPKDKQARLKAKAFAQTTDLKVQSVSKTYIDRTTGQRMSFEDSKSHFVDVEYRVNLQLEGMYRFDSQREASRFIADNKITFGKISEVLPLMNQDGTRNDITPTQMAALMRQLANNDTLQPGMKALLENAMHQAGAVLMTGNRVQHRALPRRNVKGASRDLVRSAVAYADANSHYMGKLKYAPQLNEALKRMHATMDVYGPNASSKSLVFDEVNKRAAGHTTSAGEKPQIVKDIMNASYLSKLFSPGYSVINGMQPWMVSLPWLSGKHAVGRVVYELGRAYNTVGGITALRAGIANTGRGFRDFNKFSILDSTDVLGSIRKNLAKEKDGIELTKVLDALQEHGLDGGTAGLEIEQANIASSRPVTGTLAKLDRASRQLPSAVEAINRSTTAVSAYRLGKASGMGSEQALQYAMDAVIQTQGDYRNSNYPLFFSSKIAGFPLQFKRYAAMMTGLIYDMGKRIITNASPGDRKAAVRQLGSLIAVQMLMAGAFSLPGLELVKLAFIIGGLFGAGDGWDDEERRLRQLADVGFGKTWGELISRGILSRALRIDLSQRVSLSDLWLYGEPQEYTRSGIAAYVGTQLAGAPGSFVMDAAQVPRLIENGDWLGATQKALPVKTFADAAKAVKDRMMGKTTTPEALLRVAGFKSASTAETEYRTAGLAKQRHTMENEYKTLSKEYNDFGPSPSLMKRIMAHNKQKIDGRPISFRWKISVKSLAKQRRGIIKRHDKAGLPPSVYQ